jgi:hypothetical protein
MQVVEQGKWNKVKISIFTAVNIVHPFSVRRFFKVYRSDMSVRFPLAVYAIIMIGTTISLAGMPSIKANIITPSSPRILPKGSKNSVHRDSILLSPVFVLASSHITSPAGADIITALPRITSVLLQKDRISVFPICTFL